MATLYCDESGFSGPRLYDDDTRYFTYAGIVIEPDEAADAVNQFKGYFGHFQGEVKFKNLMKRKDRDNVLRALDWLLDTFGSRTRIWFADKKCATAGKFFEYVFEPVLSRNNALFYKNRFHRFVAETLYCGMEAEDRLADELLQDAQALIKERNADGLKRLLKPRHILLPYASALDDIADFAVGYRQEILNEVARLEAAGESGVWAMDLTTPALDAVARAHASEQSSLTVVCDTSKPLKVYADFINAWIQTDLTVPLSLAGYKVYGRHVALKEPIRILESREKEFGNDLADLFAGMARLVVTSHIQHPAKCWSERIAKLILPSSIYPNSEYINLDRVQPFANAWVLKHLAERARNGLDPVLGMEAVYRAALAAFG